VRVRVLCCAAAAAVDDDADPRAHARERQRQRWEESFARAGTTAAVAVDNARAPLVQGKIYKGLHTTTAIIHSAEHCPRGTLPPRSNPSPSPYAAVSSRRPTHAQCAPLRLDKNESKMIVAAKLAIPPRAAVSTILFYFYIFIAYCVQSYDVIRARCMAAFDLQ